RKELAIRLRGHIEGSVDKAQQARWGSRLAPVTDSFALRVPERLRIVSSSAKAPVNGVSAYLRKARDCVQHLGWRGLARKMAGKVLTGLRRLEHTQAASRPTANHVAFFPTRNPCLSRQRTAHRTLRLLPSLASLADVARCKPGATPNAVAPEEACPGGFGWCILCAGQGSGLVRRLRHG